MVRLQPPMPAATLKTEAVPVPGMGYRTVSTSSAWTMANDAHLGYEPPDLRQVWALDEGEDFPKLCPGSLTPTAAPPSTR